MYTYCVFDDSKNMYGQCIFKSKGLFFFYYGSFHLVLHYILVLHMLLVILEMYFPKSGS